jgi:hypothetical protein
MQTFNGEFFFLGKDGSLAVAKEVFKKAENGLTL